MSDILEKLKSVEFNPFLELIDIGYTEELKAVTYHHFDEWISEGFHGPLNYLSDERKEKRKNIQSIFPQAKSLVTLGISYEKFHRFFWRFIEKQEKYNGLKIASFALAFNGYDYHLELSRLLNPLKLAGFIDVMPVLDRDIFYRSGLGWYGKNSMMINPHYGSFFMIYSFILEEKIAFNFSKQTQMRDHCGTCTACLDSCPTTAIIPQKRTIDAAKCISTFTIEEFKDKVPPVGYVENNQEIFGCDICQDVCPWNKKIGRKDKKLNDYYDLLMEDFIEKNPLLKKIVHFFYLTPLDEIERNISDMSNNDYRRFFYQTSFYRLGKRGMIKNLRPFLNDS